MPAANAKSRPTDLIQPSRADQIDLSKLPMSELVELQAQVLDQVKHRMREKAKQFEPHIGQSFNVYWYSSNGYFPAKLLKIHQDTGLLEVEWLVQEEGYSKTALVSADCLSGRVSLDD